MIKTAKILTSSAEDIHSAAHLLNNKGLVAFGTETVYGLGANAYEDEAVQRIYEAKQRPAINPLIHHFASQEDAFAHALNEFPLKDFALEMAKRFWPGPLTLILPANPNAKLTATACANLKTFAARVPDKKVALDLIKAAGVPIVAPSANPSGKISPTLASHVIDHLGDRIDAVIDSGPCQFGVESTILDVSGDQPIILREGAITQEMIKEVADSLHNSLGNSATKPNDTAPKAPGALSSHYSPNLKVVLDQLTCGPEDALLAFGKIPADLIDHPVVYNLSPKADLNEAASNLYSALHELDHLGSIKGLKRICVMPIPHDGIGRAINDRLGRAAAEKNKSA